MVTRVHIHPSHHHVTWIALVVWCVYTRRYTFVGKDWSHAGVASLYKAVPGTAYEILYLSSRAIGMAVM